MTKISWVKEKRKQKKSEITIDLVHLHKLCRIYIVFVNKNDKFEDREMIEYEFVIINEKRRWKSSSK